MIILGLILLVIGLVAAIHLLFVIGLVVLVIGLVLALLSATGNAVGGRTWY